MTKKLEEEFNLPPIEEATKKDSSYDKPSYDNPTDPTTEIVEVKDVETALSNAEKIDQALQNVKGLDDHDVEMDDIGQQAMDSYQQLMNLGMNVGDREAGHIFDSASKMLKTALEAKESKVNAKLKQIDLMLKKARVDGTNNGNGTSSGGTSLDRNELLRIINNKGE
tara:strand:+ start:5921 stop:6421 length:501 start_codon:yes stop_codon:yes gene_type:complete